MREPIKKEIINDRKMVAIAEGFLKKKMLDFNPSRGPTYHTASSRQGSHNFNLNL